MMRMGGDPSNTSLSTIEDENTTSFTLNNVKYTNQIYYIKTNHGNERMIIDASNSTLPTPIINEYNEMDIIDAFREHKVAELSRILECDSGRRKLVNLINLMEKKYRNGLLWNVLLKKE